MGKQSTMQPDLQNWFFFQSGHLAPFTPYFFSVQGTSPYMPKDAAVFKGAGNSQYLNVEFHGLCRKRGWIVWLKSFPQHKVNTCPEGKGRGKKEEEKPAAVGWNFDQIFLTDFACSGMMLGCPASPRKHDCMLFICYLEFMFHVPLTIRAGNVNGQSFNPRQSWKRVLLVAVFLHWQQVQWRQKGSNCLSSQSIHNFCIFPIYVIASSSFCWIYTCINQSCI